MLSPHGGGVRPWFACSSPPTGKVSLQRRRRRAQRLPPKALSLLDGASNVAVIMPLLQRCVGGGGAARPRGCIDNRTCHASQLCAPCPQALPLPWNCASRSPSGSDASALRLSFSTQDGLSTTANPSLAGMHLHLHNETGQLFNNVVPDALEFLYLILDCVRLLPLLLL